MKFILSCFLIAFMQNAIASDVTPKKNSRTGMLSWHAEEPEISLELIQLLPDYVKAVFSSRGLPKELINTLQDYCVFGTIIKNKSTDTVSYQITDWRYITADGKEHKIKTKSAWAKQWADMNIPFRWLLLPENQEFNVGDWSQGFTTIKLAPATLFSLRYSWSHQGKTKQRTLNNLSCAPATMAIPTSNN